ncbi:MAG: molybdenum cofactor guanylyltransferase [Niastella sp.]|nr:molybdenum cofactor guanylyltransferase [Niastella sp.]
MGTDKGLIKLEAKSWAQTALDKLMALQLPVVLSVNALQYETYPAVFPVEQLVKDNDRLDIHGPLVGVLSVHERYPGEDLLVLACDMPLMDSAVLEQLMTAGKFGDKDAYVFTNQGEPEPLCAIYKTKALAATLQSYHNNELTRHSMKFMLEHLAVHFIPLQPGQEQYFRNFNAHAELNGL